MSGKIVITGLGVISSIGIGWRDFSRALFQGKSGISEIDLFDTRNFQVKNAGQIQDFKAQDFLGTQGLRTLDRSTKLLLSAARLALDEAKILINAENTGEIGIAVGTTFGSLESISSFDKVALTDGPAYVNPALFSNTVINSPASQLAIRFGITGFNATISNGFSASLDAIKYACDFLNQKRATIVLAAGVEELCVQTFLGFYKLGCLAGLKTGPAISCPYDKRRNGLLLGEGACVLVLEDLACALQRKAKIYAEILGFGRARQMSLAMQRALEEAALAPEDIDYICACANSTLELDRLESEAIKKVFLPSNPYVSSVKSMLGECLSAGGALAVAAGLASIENQCIAPNINYVEKDPQCDLNIVKEAFSDKVQHVLINAFSKDAFHSSLIIGRYFA